MAHLMTLPTIGIVALAGAGLGLHLGKSSVSEINPIYFQEPPTRFHSDLSAYQSPTSSGYVARQDLGSPLQLGAGCIGCRTYPEEYFPQRDPAVVSVIEGTADQTAPVQLAVAEAAPDTDLVRRQSDLDRVQRYAEFAIGAEEERTSAPASVDGEATAVQGEEVAAAE